MSGKLIAFDGLDCSFKETNSKAYLKYLQDKGEKAVLYSFPRYEIPQSIFVKEYLAGKYGGLNDTNPTVISMFYMLDMFDCAQKEIIPKLKEGYTVILDRYWYCNLFYRAGTYRMLYNGMAKKPNVISNDGDTYFEDYIIREVEQLAVQLKLPRADIIIKLKSDPDVMLDFVHRKRSKKDQHESNDKFLLSVANVFDTIDLSEYANDKAIEVYTTENGQIRSKEDIFKRILGAIYE